MGWPNKTINRNKEKNHIKMTDFKETKNRSKNKTKTFLGQIC